MFRSLFNLGKPMSVQQAPPRKVPRVRGHLPIPDHLLEKLGPPPSQYTPEELADLRQQQLAQPGAGTWWADEVVWVAKTEEQKQRAQRRREALYELGERAMALDPVYKREVEEWRHHQQQIVAAAVEEAAQYDL